MKNFLVKALMPAVAVVMLVVPSAHAQAPAKKSSATKACAALVNLRAEVVNLHTLQDHLKTQGMSEAEAAVKARELWDRHPDLDDVRKELAGCK